MTDHSEADLARWQAMLARGHVVRAAIAGLLTVDGTTPANAARTLRVWADLVEGRAEAVERVEKAMAEAAAKAATHQKSAASSQQGTPA
jgi:hypothetical protein